MATDKKTMDLNDPKVMRELMVNLRDSIQDYLDNMEIDKAEQKKAKKEKK
jgi:hypothetical protein